MNLLHDSANSEFIKLLLHSGANVNAVDRRGATALMKLVESSTHSETIKLLLQYGANVNAVNESGATILMKHVENSATGEAIKILLESGANVDAVNADGETAVTKLVRKIMDLRNIEFTDEIFLDLRRDIFAKHKYSEDERDVVLLRASRTWLWNSMRILLSSGFDKQNREKAQALAATYEDAVVK